ncbi:MAG: hypothetical protein KGI33_02190 [Thaumarchaeota archaeon]|nr:hypothetical protein [Nitrososphaerota archaeon]
MDACDARTKAYKNGRTFDQSRKVAESLSSEIAGRVDVEGQVAWKDILEVSGHDELVYKLTLKYLRQAGYNIGDWKVPRVTAPTA